VDEKFQMEHEEDGSENWKLQRKKRLFLFKLLVIKVVFLLCKIFKFRVEEYKKKINKRKKQCVAIKKTFMYNSMRRFQRAHQQASVSDNDPEIAHSLGVIT
jgi:hypothetical protein